MHTERLKGHSCTHCEQIVLPGEPEEIQQDDQNPWDTPLSGMRFSNEKVNRLGISLADLEEKSTGGCEFALYLRQRIEAVINERHNGHKQPKPEAVQLFVFVTENKPGFYRSFAFYALVHLGAIHDPLTSTLEVDLNRCYARIGRSAIYCHLTADEGHNMGRFVSTTPRMALEPLSDQTMCLVRQWKNRCTDEENSQHKICSISERRFLPCRLVELTPKKSEIELRLVRSDSMGDSMGDCMGTFDYDRVTYSALSYCWGLDGQPEKLTAANLRSYERDGIPWQSLPKTLKDAAITTHLLGMRYLWIDSLCIMQGDGDEDRRDKEKEISQMAMVYLHATFTIMARRGDKAADGFLHDRTPPSGTSLLPFRANDEQHGWVTVTFLSAVQNEDNTALDTRGWVMQEYVLSRRLIIFGTWSTEWSCRKEREINRDGWYRDLSGRPGDQDPFNFYAGWERYGSPTGSAAAESIDKSHLSDAIMFFSANPKCRHRKPEVYAANKAWEQLIQTYTRRKLSKNEDRILAISGLAERFAPTISQSKRYIAGLWECKMPEALLWSSALRFPSARPTIYQGPSWSWVSVNTPTIGWGSSNCISRVLSIDYVLSNPEAPYGAVTSAALRIEGPAFSIDWRYARHDDELSHSNGRNECRWRSDEEDENSVDPHVDIRLDAREDDKRWRNVVLLAMEPGEYSIKGIVLTYL